VQIVVFPVETRVAVIWFTELSAPPQFKSRSLSQRHPIRLSPPSVVGVAAAIGWSSSPGRVNNFVFSTLSRPALGSKQPPIQRVPWEAVSPGMKRPGREADH
jgi:hypothetical protein